MTDPAAVVARHRKKTIALAHSKARLELAVAQELFSSHAVDVGTALLIRMLSELPGIRAVRRALDVGCGYGPLGLLLAAWNPDAEVHCVDRDALAVAFTAYNAAQNSLAGVRAYAGLGYDDVAGGDFDVVTSNIPAKAGPAVIAALVRDARHYLAPAGVAAVVGIDRIAPVIADALTDPVLELLQTRTARGYSCFLYRSTAPPPQHPERTGSFARGDYHRQEVTVRLGGAGASSGGGRGAGGGGGGGSGGMTVRLVTAWGLPEFDTIGYPTELSAALLADIPRGRRERPVVFAPGQGHLPVLLARLGAREVCLVDRDLLALRVSAANLRAAGLPADRIRTVLAADAEPVTDVDCGVAVLRDPQAQVTNAAAVGALRDALPGAVMVVAGGSTAVTRAIDTEGLSAAARKRRAGASAVRVQVPRSGASSRATTPIDSASRAAASHTGE